MSLFVIKVQRCFQGDQLQLVSNVECFKGIHTCVILASCMLSCDVSFLPSHYSGRQLAGFMLATAVTVHVIAGNVEVD